MLVATNTEWWYLSCSKRFPNPGIAYLESYQGDLRELVLQKMPSWSYKAIDFSDSVVEKNCDLPWNLLVLKNSPSPQHVKLGSIYNYNCKSKHQLTDQSTQYRGNYGQYPKLQLWMSDQPYEPPKRTISHPEIVFDSLLWPPFVRLVIQLWLRYQTLPQLFLRLVLWKWNGL